VGCAAEFNDRHSFNNLNCTVEQLAYWHIGRFVFVLLSISRSQCHQGNQWGSFVSLFNLEDPVQSV
jgi:hypothetical protein